jgi:hypothetical protein
MPQKTKKVITVISVTGIVLCGIFLLPAVQNALLSFAEQRYHFANASEFRVKVGAIFSLALLPILACIFVCCCLYAKTIALFFEDKKNETRIAVGTGILSVAGILCIAVFSYNHGSQWLSSDDSSEMVLARLLAGENALVSSSWQYSTEIRLVYQTFFTMPLFKLFGHLNDWALIRAMNIVLNNLLLAVSYRFMMRRFKAPQKWISLTALALLLPLSGFYWNIVLFGGYYVFFIAQLFICLGLFAGILNAANTKALISNGITFALLSFILGVQGIRALLCVHIPLVIACAAVYAAKVHEKKNTVLLSGVCGTFFCAVGFAANYALHFFYSFYAFTGKRLENMFDRLTAKAGAILVSFAAFFGFTPGQPVQSAGGVLGMASVVFTILFFAALAAWFRRNRGASLSNEEDPKTILVFFFLSQLMFNIFVFLVIDETVTERYVIPFMIFYIPLLAFFFKHIEQSYTYLKRIAALAGILLFLSGSSFLRFRELAVTDYNTHRHGYIRYLLDNNLEYGFSNFWNANVTTELTNGRISVAGLEPDNLKNNIFKIHVWLNPAAFYNASFRKQEPSFLLLANDEWDMAKKAGRPFAESKPDYDDGRYIVLRFPDTAIIYNEVLDK